MLLHKFVKWVRKEFKETREDEFREEIVGMKKSKNNDSHVGSVKLEFLNRECK